MKQQSMQQRRSAVTLVEMLVVLVILLGLLALLLPAVQSARERSRQATCQNHLRQLSLAVRGYVEVNKRLPDRPTPGISGGWSVAILPYLEQSALADQLQSLPLDAIPSQFVARPAIFICPSVAEGESQLAAIPAAHYVLAAHSSRQSWSLADAPKGFAVPWLTGPELPHDQLMSQKGPHKGGTQIVNTEGAVQIHMP
jgi:type II secretory pathway pseudopilin PulG